MGGPGMGGSGKTSRRTNKKSGRDDRADEGKKAFVVTINGTTPHAIAPLFLTGSLMKQLEQYGEDWARKEKKGFWINHVKLLNCQQPLITAKERERFKEDDMPTDPVTGEPILDDASFAIAFVVNIGAPPDESADKDQSVNKSDKRKNKKGSKPKKKKR